MNLHGIVSGAIGAVNPPIAVRIKPSVARSTDASGRVVPQYATPIDTFGNKQDLTGDDIAKLNGFGIQGVVCKMYLNGNYEGLFRVLNKGGDLLIFENQTYLVARVLERWHDWCCLALTMQTDGPNP